MYRFADFERIYKIFDDDIYIDQSCCRKGAKVDTVEARQLDLTYQVWLRITTF